MGLKRADRKTTLLKIMEMKCFDPSWNFFWLFQLAKIVASWGFSSQIRRGKFLNLKNSPLALWIWTEVWRVVLHFYFWFSHSCIFPLPLSASRLPSQCWLLADVFPGVWPSHLAHLNGPRISLPASKISFAFSSVLCYVAASKMYTLQSKSLLHFFLSRRREIPLWSSLRLSLIGRQWNYRRKLNLAGPQAV